jgi:hypothetical protein
VSAAGIQSQALHEGIDSEASGIGGVGVFGVATDTTSGTSGGENFGVYGRSNGPYGVGVYGTASGVYPAIIAYNGGSGYGLLAQGTPIAAQIDGSVRINSIQINPAIELMVQSSDSNNVAADITLLPYGISNGFDLSVSGTGPNDLNFGIFKTDGSGYSQYLGVDASGNLTIAGANATKAGGSGTWITSSDRRIKQDIHPIADAIETVLKLRPVSFHYTPEYRATENNFADKPYMGFIAQEFREVFPDAVSSTGKPVPGAPAGDMPILAVDTDPALITTVAAVQELAVESFDRDDQIAKLRAENAQLQTVLQQEHANLQEISERLSRLEHARQ